MSHALKERNMLLLLRYSGFYFSLLFGRLDQISLAHCHETTLYVPCSGIYKAFNTGLLPGLGMILCRLASPMVCQIVASSVLGLYSDSYIWDSCMGLYFMEQDDSSSLIDLVPYLPEIFP